MPSHHSPAPSRASGRTAVRIERVAFAYSDAVPLLADVDVHVPAGFTGIVGENGAGKSTLLRLVGGELAPSAGRVIVEPHGAVIAWCRQGVDVLDADIRALAERDDAAAGRWRGVLALEPRELARWATLSPGERRRWQLGAALAREPDVLLLDEPTNHVDSAARASAIGALRRFHGVALVISHDRAVLDALTTATLRVHAGTASLVPGGYTRARQTWEADEAHARAVRAESQRAVHKAARKLADAQRDQRAADTNRSAGRRMKTMHDLDASSGLRKGLIAGAEATLSRRVEVRRREVERAEAAVGDAPTTRAIGRSVFVGYARAPRRWLFELAADRLGAGDASDPGHASRTDDRTNGTSAGGTSDDDASAAGHVGATGAVILRDVRVAVGAADRIRIAGANGAGKTTLVRALLAASTLPADRVLYLPQELPDGAAQALLATARGLPAAERGRVLSLVAALGVEPDRLLASRAPSPGEARKLALALGLGRHAWCLVLDEPTNHLDLPSIERLEDALDAFPGALVLISHDDALAQRCTTQTWRVADGRCEVA